MKDQASWMTSALSAGAAVTGVVVGAPVLVVAGTLATGICIWGVASEQNRYQKKIQVFKDCHLYKDVDETRYYPLIMSSCDDYILIDLPGCMSLKDVVAAKETMERWYGRQILIEETTNKKIVIKILSPKLCEEDRWINIFHKIDLVSLIGDYPRLIDSQVNNIGQRLVFSLPPNMTLDTFKKKQEELEYLIKYKVEMKVEKYKLIIQTITREFQKSYSIDFRKNILCDMKFIVGIGVDGEHLTMDLGGNSFSTLICGASGGGKSVWLNTLFVQFILRDIEIYGIDLKAVEFNIFKNYRNMTKYATSRKEAVQILAEAYDLMMARYNELEEKQCKSYADYNKKFNNAMNPIIIAIDEYSVLMDDKAAKKFLFELLSRARASNLLVLISTQTPRAKILDGTIRCNIKNTVCFATETDQDSEVVLGKGNYRATRELTSPGRGFLKYEKELKLFQGFYLTDEQIESQIRHKMTVRKTVEAKADTPASETTNEKVIPIPTKKVAKKDKKQKVNVKELLSKIEDL